ncbi:ArsA-related P-loop ATPase [bacterium]
MNPGKKNIIAVCGKGGVGKTAVAALLSRAMIASGGGPLLMIDADPAGGLFSAIGEKTGKTLAGVREELIGSAREAGGAAKDELARRLDYMVMEALVERKGYALLAMGRSKDSRCFCPANTLLRDAVDVLAGSFRTVLIDAEAGLEQIQRRVTRNVSLTLAVTDGSVRSANTIEAIAGMLEGKTLVVLANRIPEEAEIPLPVGIDLIGDIPEDPALAEFDREGRSLWELPDDNPAVVAASAVADVITKISDA